MKTSDDAITRNDLAQLNAFLRGERAAVESYTRAIARSDQIHPELFAARGSHLERIDLLSRHIWKQGGVPDDLSGPWGAFTRTLTRFAAALNDRAAIVLLEEGEELGSIDYRVNIDKLPLSCQDFVRREVMTRQERSQELMSGLKHRIAA